MSEHLLVERRGGVLLLTMNRPEALNALMPSMTDEMRRTVEDAVTDSDVRALVITGAGRAFSAGGDVKNMAAQTGRRTPNDVRRRIREGTGPLIMAIATIEKPVVAAVNGLAYGGGFSIAMACDIVYAARSARFAQAFVKRGLVPDTGSTWFLPRLIGPWRARELMFTGEPVDAERASALGLVNRVCDDATVLDEAIALAEKLAAGPTMAIGMIKTLVSEGMRGDLRQAIDAEADAQGIAMESEDFREGVAALLDKRDPAFQGR
ncbi:MAG TPA: enoyl-CoA hydratase-related protein [Candidatus Dormibacteraeota bacterium]|nr:enoyl-CoA hydratase-related protein [Candidatus Dormibacteraeota bacterium]